MPVPPGGVNPPSPYDPTDAVLAAARFLCANGAAGGANLPGAVYVYNHSAAYVSEALTLAESYGQGSGSGASAGSGAGSVAVQWALTQAVLLTSGAGRHPASASTARAWCRRRTGSRVSHCRGWPRTSSTRRRQCRRAGRSNLETSSSSEAARRRSTTSASMSVSIGGQAVMVDAPHTGADVRVEPFPDPPGAAWGGLSYVGATRP